MRELVAALALACLTGCATPLYDWGGYEDSVLVVQGEYLDVDLIAEIETFEQHIDELRRRDEHPGPGVHAHVGYLHYTVGNSEAALRHFEAEKAFYPESTRFMDMLIGRL